MSDATHAPSASLSRVPLLRRVAAAVSTAVKTISRRRRHGRAIETLHRLNDHHLKDIGISRDQIEHAVRSGGRWG
jgi:uncharacterized protein YjiS (DUF1127 family)